MKVALKFPRSKITWMIIILVALFLGYLVYKGVFIYKEGVYLKTTCQVRSCANAGNNCGNAIERKDGKWYECTESETKCTRSSKKYEGEIKPERCKRA